MSQAAVFTISDSRSAGTAPDLSGPAAAQMLTDLGINVVEQQIIPDQKEDIAAAVRRCLDRVSLVVTTGGTGIGPRDVTPQALAPLFDRDLPGFGEIMRTTGYAKTPLSIISRGAAGIAGNTLIVMLPGSPGAVRDGLSVLGPAITHVLEFLENRPVDCRTDSQSHSP